jgi:uncharacterized membrane protein YsdA (DUF1294 family)
MHNYWFLYYIGIINLMSGILFAYDKSAAKQNRRRIAEHTLHLFELAGGVVANMVLIYILHHKNRKFSYYVWTWLILIAWITAAFYLNPIW